MTADGLTYDAGALIAAERDDRVMWALHRAAIARGLPPTVAAGVLAEAWRGGPQDRLSRLLEGCRVEELSEVQARQVGVLIARSGLDDTVDVAVAEGAIRRNDAVVTSNRSHIEQVAGSVGKRVTIHDV
ncbi:MAG: twitching motility protein PilT [Acidimicrobiales bacterium]